MKKIYLLCCVLVMHITVNSQIISVQLNNIQACGGATLMPFVVYSGTLPPITVHYERQGAASAWFEVASQVYDVQASYIVVSPTDISSATNYRIRVVNMATLQEYISAGVTVNPATWNVNRGAPILTLSTGWGTDCSNSGNFIGASINSTTGGRPPYRVEYKEGASTNWLVAGEANGYFPIMGILPNVFYNVRVVDYCGNVSAVQNARITATAIGIMLQDAATCNDGIIQVNAIGGIAPFEYGIGKVVAQMPTIIPEFTYDTANTFVGLAPGDYYVSVRDACGNIANNGFVRLGGGFPRFLASASIPAGDSCTRYVTVHSILQGAGPFEYGIRYIQDPQSAWSWQTSNSFTNLSRVGVYFVKIKDKCGQLSDSVATFVNFPEPRIDSITHSNLPGCNQDITVHASNGYKPYEYGINVMNNSTITWQTSNVFTNIAPGNYQFRIKDRCGRIYAVTNDILLPKELNVHIRAQKDSCGAGTGFISIDSVTNGIAPFQYAIRNMSAPGNTYTPFTSDSVFYGLAPGLYSVWVKGGCAGEKIIDDVRIGAAMTYDYDVQPGTICAPFVVVQLRNASGGPWTYHVTNGTFKRTSVLNDSVFVLLDMPNGSYTITITNACGDTATTTLPPLVINSSIIPNVTFEVQYLPGCTEANLIVRGAPAGSTYELYYPNGDFRTRPDSVFNTTADNMPSGRYQVMVLKEIFCNGNSFLFYDSVTIALSGTNLTGTVNTNLPDSFCIYNGDAIRLADYLVDAHHGGSWTSTAPQGFDAANGSFTPLDAGPGQYEFTYGILDSCGTLHETSFFLTVASESCQIRAIVGDYHSSVQPEGCPEILAGQYQVYDFTDNDGNLLFTLDAAGRDLGTVCAGVRIVNGNGSTLRSAILDGKTTYFLDRNFYIESSFEDGTPIQVKLYFTDEEIENMLDFLHANGYPTAGPGDIRILQKSGDNVDLQVTNEAGLDPSLYDIITPVVFHNGMAWVMQFEVFHFSEFNPHFTATNGNLPLTLLDFNGANRQGQIRLQWKTTNESNTSHFDLERSNNGNTFQHIARIIAAGNASTERLYTHDDQQPLAGNNFYRLKMVDLDGKHTYSKTILVRSAKVSGIRISPNPARDHLFVSTPDNTKAMAIRIYDATGRLLYHERVNGNQLLKVQTGHLRNGWYMLELQTSTGSMREAFLKQ